MSALFVKQLTTLDFSYLCPERGLVGETWLVDLTLSGELDEQGMVFDFGHVKKQVKASLDLLADHRLLVPATNTGTKVQHKGKSLHIDFQTRFGTISCQCPAQAALLIHCDEITITELKPWLEQALTSELPDNVDTVNLTIYPEAINSAYYHYSHGLKKHLGDCQRIAHGHRSRIEIQVDDKRDSELENLWAKRWQDIYIATREDLLETLLQGEASYHRFGYQADQGYFELVIPESRCYLIDTDSTIELLSQHIADQLAELRPGQTIEVIAYEGFNKGAVAFSGKAFSSQGSV